MGLSKFRISSILNTVCPLFFVIIYVIMESPIRSMQASSSHRSSQVYEEEFWKLKAQRAEAAAEKLKQQNQQLTKQLAQPPRLALNEQTLPQSTQSIDKNDRNDVEKLMKELRMVKNSKEVETAQLNEEIRSLKKQLRDTEASLADLKGKQIESKGLAKLEEENARLVRRLQSSEEERARLREEKTRIVGECEEFKREAQELRLRERLAQREEQEKFQNYRKYCEEQADLTLSQRQPMSRISQREELNEEQPEPTATPTKPEELSTLKQQLTSATQQIENLHFELQSVKNIQLSSGIREKRLQAEAEEAKQQLQRVLEKLAPLLANRQQLAVSRQNVQARASLSLLQVFLKKYKIQSF